MSAACPACGHTLAAEARFCSSCGAARTMAPTPPPATLSGERRQMTTLFADLVGSTDLVDRMDPEDLLDAMAAYHAAIRDTVVRFGGSVLHYLGDGVVAAFGYPTAHEDDGVHAVQAGLAIVEALAALNAAPGRPSAIALQVRVGLSTGMIVAQTDAARPRVEDSFIGAALNVASRLQSIAAPGEVVIDQPTLRLVGHSVVTRPLGPQALKGFAQPVEAFVAMGVVEQQSRLARRLGVVRAPMVDREHERGLLAALVGKAAAGEPQIVSLVGEAGIGKSRLVQAVHDETAEPRFAVVTLQCSAALMNTALHPHIEQLQRQCGITPRDDAGAQLGKLRVLLATTAIDEPDALPILASLLSIVSEDVPPLAMSPPAQKARTFAVLQALLVEQVRRTPTIVLYEDLHWLDPTSGEFLSQLVETCGSVPLLLLGTTRPGSSFAWPDLPNLTHIAVGRLGAAESGEIARALGATAGLPPDTIARIVARTDGVPLFVEEMTRMLVEAPDGSGRRVLPETLMDLLTERLDGLGRAKLLIQVGAVVGRAFRPALVAAALGRDEADLRDDVATIMASGLVEGGAEGVLQFKHALVQDAAYDSILTRHRRELHERVAVSLQENDAELCQREPELLARHLTNAGRPLDAASWWLLGGRQAIGRGSAREAAALLQAGLDALFGCERTERLLAAELDLLALLGPAQMVLNGPGHPAFGEVQRRAYDTSLLLPGTPALFPITYGLALFHWGKAEFATALSLAETLAATSQADPTPEHVMAANVMAGMIRFHSGEPLAGKRHLETAVALYAPADHAPLYPRYMMDFGVFGRFYLALCCAMTDEGERASVLAQEAVSLAEQLGQPHSRGFSLLASFIVAMLRGDGATARLWATRCVPFAEEMGFPEFVAFAEIAIGWADMEEGDLEAGLGRLENGFLAWKATGFETWQTWFGALRAEGLARLGRHEEARDELRVQDRRLAQNGERQFTDALERMRELLAGAAFAAGARDAGSAASPNA